jgi:pimeloyl-ACP methyl ester carboxylesterase
MIGEHLQRAGVYYHFAKFLFVHDVAQMQEAHMKAVACRTLALPHMVPAGERVYYAPRAAAFENRVRACIALSGPFDFLQAWDGLPELTREAFRVRSHCATEEDAKRNAATLSLKEIASRITCPLFVVAGKQDRVVPWQDAERLVREAKSRAELLIIEDGGHVANNRSYRWRSQSADWMAERLA